MRRRNRRGDRRRFSRSSCRSLRVSGREPNDLESSINIVVCVIWSLLLHLAWSVESSMKLYKTEHTSLTIRPNQNEQNEMSVAGAASGELYFRTT